MRNNLKKLKIVQKFGFLFILWFLIHSCIVLIDGLNDTKTTAEFAIVLGSTVNEDGTLSDKLKARLDKGIELYFTHKIKKIYVSGGLGKEGHYEGTKMAEYLLLNNISKADITIDNKGNTTHLTAINFKKDYPNCKSVIVVSQYFHLLRTKLAVRQAGVEKVTSAHCNYFEIRDFYSVFREFFAYYKYLWSYNNF